MLELPFPDEGVEAPFCHSSWDPRIMRLPWWWDCDAAPVHMLSTSEALEREPFEDAARRYRQMMFLYGGCVYGLYDRTALKIGYTTNLASRVGTLQPGNPNELTYKTLIPGTLQDEARIHRVLTGSRIRGEWFAANRRVWGLLQGLAEERNRALSQAALFPERRGDALAMFLAQ